MDHFGKPKKSISWAMECLGKAQDELMSYIKAGGFEFVVENDEEKFVEIRKFRQAKPLPDSLEGYLRNAFVDLKHSFDQSLFAASRATGADRYSGNYPWADSDIGLTAILAKRQKKDSSKLSSSLLDEIWRQQPYSTGPINMTRNNLAREIARVVNDKHTIGFTPAAALRNAYVPIVFMQAPANGVASMFEAWDPVKKEMVISRKTGEGGSISNYEPQVQIDIMLDVDGVLRDVPVQILVHEFAEHATFVLEGFEAVCGHAGVPE
jgi:hypothetical protein